MNERISVGGSIFGKINFALQQNYVPVIKNLILTNNTQELIQDITLRITFEPQFAHEYEYHLVQLDAMESVEITPVKIVLIPDYMISLTEKLVGNMHIVVETKEEAICIKEEEVELLAYDQWTGITIMPEMVSAFVTPNHNKISEVISQAGLFLQKWTGSPSFTEYQTQNPNEEKKQMAAIYAAIQAQNLAYLSVPASYESVGQRIRLPYAVLEQKGGTCLDLSLLYLSCLEAVGLNGILVFIENHAFAGCWLEDETFMDCVQDDPSALTKRFAAGIHKLTVVECTDFVAGKTIEFDLAERRAKDYFIKQESFLLSVDIKRCRNSGIRPLPQRIVVDGQYQVVDYGERKDSDLSSMPADITVDSRIVMDPDAANVTMTKQKMWERKLLDLSLRNALLNFRVNKSAVQFMVSDLGTLQDELARGGNLSIVCSPTEWDHTLRDSKIYDAENQQTLVEKIAEVELHNKRIRTFLKDNELQVNLKNLQRMSKLSIEENGANNLYIALGFLKWYETDKSEKERYAPLILIPVELVRKVRDHSYVIHVRDEEPQVNITLLELLRQDYGIVVGGLDPLPMDDNGVDVSLIFTIIRQAIMSKRGWDIVNLAFLGLFSFSQFIMWNDLRNRAEDLEQNKVVKSLISGKMEWEPEQGCMEASDLDAMLKPSDLAIPTSVDSSQLVAICAAAKGQSFVLHGPPGTGKSQTITNMIANALYQGKSVLFVAEKMAALTVVQKRLAAVGLDPFCLELHSNKANKRSVLEQLSKTLEIGQFKSPESYERTAEKLFNLRTQLNEVVTELHKRREFGFSVYEAICRYETLKEYEGRISFTPETLNLVKGYAYDSWTDVLNRLVVAARECGGIKDHVFRAYKNPNYSLDIRDQLRTILLSYQQTMSQLRIQYRMICDALGISSNQGWKQVDLIRTIVNVFVHAKYLLPGLFQKTNSADSLNSTLALNYEAQYDQIEQLITIGAEKTKLEQEIVEEFHASILDYDAELATLKWKQSESSWLIPKVFGQRKLLKEIRLYAKTPEIIQKANITAYYDKLIAYKGLKNQLVQNQALLSSLFGGLWNLETKEWEVLEKTYEDSFYLRKTMDQLELPEPQESSFFLKMRKYSENCAVVQQKHATLFQDFIQTFDECMKIESQLSGEFCVETEQLLTKNWFETIDLLCDTWLSHMDELKAWSGFLKQYDIAKQIGLKDVIDALWDGKVEENDLISSFECNLSFALAARVINQTPVLAQFQGALFNETIQQYNKINAEFETLSIKELAAKLSSKVPAASAYTAESSELGILQKAIRSNGRMMSIRKLFDSIPQLLHRLTPCMLMSPMSVAQYIDPSFPKFDLVIFDEASQLPTSEAVGTIARGNNVIVVGDPKQLPPTSFFKSNYVDEENYEKEDLESLLDDCLALNMPQVHLLWHYRSRHESLIAYSNHKYYDNKLYTFPSPNDLISKVTFVPVTGYYDRGGTRQNRGEAEAIVEEITRRLKDEQLRSESIGVVTFSAVQQNLIDDLLTEQFIQEPELEELANTMYEPIFIKNLENVQGDERDVILFSIGYGPTKEGKVPMNFGPLNSEGGWRRLNVAISRARKAMTIFSVLQPDQIDLTRTNSEGIAGLKGFLEFAQKGKNVLATHKVSVKKKEYSIEKIIANRIEQLGYQTKQNIGCSEYKIDLGIIHPKDPNTYLLGILLDGPNYHMSGTAKDRNILQPKVLKGLGWNLSRVWILDWLDSPNQVLQRIEREIGEALKKSGDVPSVPVPEPRKPIQFEKIETASIQNENQTTYRCLELGIVGTAEEFYSKASTEKIRKKINNILTYEAPISKKALYKRILAAWQISRMGKRVEAILYENLVGMPVRYTNTNDEVFLWRQDQDPDIYCSYRTNMKRAIEEICAQEIANAVRELLSQQISIAKPDLMKEIAKFFGFTRFSPNMENTINAGIEEARKREYILESEDDERVSIRE